MNLTQRIFLRLGWKRSKAHQRHGDSTEYDQFSIRSPERTLQGLCQVPPTSEIHSRLTHGLVISATCPVPADSAFFRGTPDTTYSANRYSNSVRRIYTESAECGPLLPYRRFFSNICHPFANRSSLVDSTKEPRLVQFPYHSRLKGDLKKTAWPESTRSAPFAMIQPASRWKM